MSPKKLIIGVIIILAIFLRIGEHKLSLWEWLTTDPDKIAVVEQKSAPAKSDAVVQEPPAAKSAEVEKEAATSKSVVVEEKTPATKSATVEKDVATSKSVAIEEKTVVAKSAIDEEKAPPAKEVETGNKAPSAEKISVWEWIANNRGKGEADVKKEETTVTETAAKAEAKHEVAHTATEAAKPEQVAEETTTPDTAQGRHASPKHVAKAEEKHSVATKKAHGIHWGYKGPTGPDNWGSLAEKYAQCKNGTSQSPVDLPPVNALFRRNGKAPGVTQSLVVHYKMAPLKVKNNGHTIQADLPGAGYIIADGKKYELLQFHFHAPSENTIAGRNLPMEAHLVHKSADGELAVIGVLLGQGPENRALRAVWDAMPTKAGGLHEDKNIMVEPEKLLPPDRSFYTFSGSLTTPPCSEGVRWIVMAMPMHLSKTQIDQFRALHPDSNRPTQPWNKRTVTLNRHGMLLTGAHQSFAPEMPKIAPPPAVKKPVAPPVVAVKAQANAQAAETDHPKTPPALQQAHDDALDWAQGVMRMHRVAVGSTPSDLSLCDITMRRIMPMRFWRMVDIRPSKGVSPEQGKGCTMGNQVWGGHPMPVFPRRYH